MYPNHPSIEDPQRFVHGQEGNPARRSWLDALNAARRESEPPEAGSFFRQMFAPTIAPKPWKKKGK
jgi:hypothetical protein